MKFVAHELPLRTVFGAKGWVYWRRIAHVLELYVKVSPDIWVQGQISTPSDLSSFVRASWNCRSVGTLPQELKKKNKKTGVCLRNYQSVIFGQVQMIYVIHDKIWNNQSCWRTLKLFINKTCFSLTFVLVYRKNPMYRKWIHARQPPIRLGMGVNIQDGPRYVYYLLN